MYCYLTFETQSDFQIGWDWDETRQFKFLLFISRSIELNLPLRFVFLRLILNCTLTVISKVKITNQMSSTKNDICQRAVILNFPTIIFWRSEFLWPISCFKNGGYYSPATAPLEMTALLIEWVENLVVSTLASVSCLLIQLAMVEPVTGTRGFTLLILNRRSIFFCCEQELLFEDIVWLRTPDRTEDPDTTDWETMEVPVFLSFSWFGRWEVNGWIGKGD